MATNTTTNAPQPTQPPPPPRIRACLFDMDGLLIDSEELYTICTNELLAEYGKPALPWTVKAQLQGRPGPESAKLFQAWAQLSCSPEEFAQKQGALQRRYFPSTQPLPGVVELLRTLAPLAGPAVDPARRVHIALATSSHAANYRLKTDHLQDLFALFPPEHRVLGDDPRIPPGRGKPAPDIYLLALETINARIRREHGGGNNNDAEPEIRPDECLVFEDSVPGVEAGRRAGMQVVWVPHPGLLDVYRDRVDEVLAGRTGEHKEVEEGEGEAGQKHAVEEALEGLETPRRAVGRPGEIGDGMGRMLDSLVDFPYQDYGIQV